eukprot:scaffold29481_cov104-Isochrysis_galbana.AAC.2
MADWRRATLGLAARSVFGPGTCAVQPRASERAVPRRAAQPELIWSRRCLAGADGQLWLCGNHETSQLFDVWAGHLRASRARQPSPAQRAHHGAAPRRTALPRQS